MLPPSANWGPDVVGFPFTVVKPAVRKWAAYSEPARAGGHAGKTGVIFRPSRIAGDAYEIRAYLDLDGGLDRENDFTDTDAAVKAARRALMRPTPRFCSAMLIVPPNMHPRSAARKGSHANIAICFRSNPRTVVR